MNSPDRIDRVSRLHRAARRGAARRLPLHLCLGLVLAAPGCAGGDGGEPAGVTPPGAGGTGGPQASAAADSETEPDEAAMRGEAKTERTLAAGSPVTLRVELSPELAEVVRGAGAATESGERRFLRLTLEGLENPAVPAEIRVFVNRPEADRETSLDDPHYVGLASFFPAGEEGRGEESSFLFDAGTALERLAPGERLAEERSIDVTLVLVPPGRAAPEGARIEVPFEGVRLEAVEPDAPATEPPGEGA